MYVCMCIYIYIYIYTYTYIGSAARDGVDPLPFGQTVKP